MLYVMSTLVHLVCSEEGVEGKLDALGLESRDRGQAWQLRGDGGGVRTHCAILES